MKNSQIRFNWYQLSLYIFCSYPFLFLISLKSIAAIAFVVIQLALIATNIKKQTTKGYLVPLLMVSPFLFYIIGFTYSSDLNYGFKYFERTLLLYLTPWIFFFNRSYINKESCLKTLRFLCISTCLLTVYTLIHLSFDGTLEKVSKTNDSYLVIRAQLEYVSRFHPTYFSLLLAVSILSIQSELKDFTYNLKEKKWALTGLIILILGLFIASSKMILTATFICSLLLWKERFSLKFIFLRSVVILSLIIVIVLFTRPLQERIKEFSEAIFNPKIEQYNPDSMRKAIYTCVVEVIEENILWGTGIGDQQTELNKKYNEHNFLLALEREFNSHNQYLQFWLSSGIIPFILFLVVLIFQFSVALVNRNYFQLSFLMLFSMSFLTENILARQNGLYLYAFFSPILIYTSWSKDKTVYINGKFLTQPLTGVQRYAREITYYLTSHYPKYYTVITPTKNLSLGSKSKVLAFRNSLIWEQLILPIYLVLKGSPLLINLCNTAPILYKNQIITIHDTAFKENPAWFSTAFVRWYNFMISILVQKQSIHIITVSNFSKSEIIKHFKISKQQITVLYNGCARFLKKPHSKKAIIGGKYALTVGSFNSRKNQELIIQTFLNRKDTSLKLVLVGNYDLKIFNNQEAILDKINEKNNIILIKNSTDKTLANLYQNALFTIYTPFYEGFGLPVLESLVHQKPVIVSNIPVFHELFKNHAYILKSNTETSLEEAITNLQNSLSYWENKASKASELFDLFSYEKSALKLNKIVQFHKNL